MTFECVHARLETQVPLACLGKLKTGAVPRILSSEYCYRIAKYAVAAPFRKACDLFNMSCERAGTDHEITYSTFIRDVFKIGNDLISYKKQKTREILKQHGFDPDTGLLPQGELPEFMRNKDAASVIVDPCKICSAQHLPSLMAEGWSVPDLEEFRIAQKRRKSRKLASPDNMNRIISDYVIWFNSCQKYREYGLLHPVSLEINPDEVVYISVDAVLVTEQSEQHIRGGKKESRQERTFISHWNIQIESGLFRYRITDLSRDAVYRQLIAVLLANRLTSKFMVFFTDGEKCIFEDIRKYFSRSKYVIYLDWYHAQNKVINLTSTAIKSVRVDDPRGEAEYYARGSKKGQIRKRDKTSLSKLYARAICRILWSGNVDEAIDYIGHIPPEDIKAPGWLDKLKDYIKGKSSYITCYSLRRRAGLRNSSNGVENENMILIANRQKHKTMSWQRNVSPALAALSAVFANDETDCWFNRGELPFSACAPTDTDDSESVEMDEPPFSEEPIIDALTTAIQGSQKAAA